MSASAYEGGRVTDDSAFLKDHRFEDLDPGASVGLQAESDWKTGAKPPNALIRYRQNIDSDQGAQADLRLTAGIFSRWGVEAGVFGQLTWVNTKIHAKLFRHHATAIRRYQPAGIQRGLRVTLRAARVARLGEGVEALADSLANILRAWHVGVPFWLGVPF